MKTCEFCKSVLPDDSNFCGQCGRRMSAPGEPSTGESITFVSVWPVLNDIGMAVGEKTPSNSTIKKEPVSRHDTPIIGEDEDWDHEILHTYDDVDDERAATVLHENTEEEEDEEESKFVPFLPMPGSSSIQPAGSAPLVQGPLYIDQVPFANTPHIPGPSAARIVQLGGSPAPQFTPTVQPVQPVPVPQVQLAPQYDTIPTQPLPHSRPRHHHHFLRHHHLRPTCLVVVVVSSILASIIIGIIIAFFPKTPHSPSPLAKLMGAPILGKAVILHGENFIPGETVTYTIDVKLGASTQGNARVGSSNSMNVSGLLLAPHSAQFPSLQHKTVESDGTFNATIFIDRSWSAGSNHTVYVYNHDGKLIRALPFVVVVRLAQTGLVGCVNGADPIMLGPISEGSNQRVSKAITLCTTGSGLVDWTARWDQKWLQLNHSGQITAPQHGQVSLSASAKGLKPGSYTTPVIFSSRQSNVKVSLSVTFVVLKKSPKTSLSNIECVSATPQSLSFVNTAKQSNTLLQRVTISNCGTSGTWSASVSADNGQQWLGIDSSRGTLQSGGLQDIIIAASSANLQPGTYTGHVNFSIGSSNVGVQVTFTVRPPQTAPACIHVNTQSLIFMGFAGQSDPSPQPVTLINCGATGHWATSIVTNDGVNWLSINSAGGDLREGGTQQVSVTVSSTSLLDSKGTYTGKITFAMGSSITTVNVTFIVIPQCISAGPHSLLFGSTAGQSDPSPQSVTIANCGAAGKWLGSVSTDDGANWLSINRSSDHLKVGTAQSIAVKVSGAQLSPRTYTGQVLFAMGSSTTLVQVTFIVRPPKIIQCINVNPDSLNFTSIQDRGDPDPQTVTISNCGNTGSWSSAISTDNGTPWIRTDPSGGELKGGAFQDGSIRLSTARLSIGKHVGYITFSIGSSSKDVQITLIVRPRPSRACIRVDQRSLTFTSTVAGNSTTTETISIQESGPKSQTEGITNCGDAGSWSVDDGANWLKIKPAGGDLQAGESIDVSIIVDSSSLKTGTYTATIPFKITTDAGATATARVGVTLTVSPPSLPECKAKPPSLTFTSIWGKDPPAARDVTLINCGANDTWTESDDSDTSLDVFPGSGNLDSRGSQVVSVKIDDLTTIPAKPYKYTVAFTTGNGNTVFVPVTWNLLPPSNPACIQADTSSLSFSVTQGESTGTSSNFINCGAYTGTVLVEPSTSDSGDWLTVRSLDGSDSYPVGYGPDVLISLDSTNLVSDKTYTGSIKATIITPQGPRASVTESVTFKVQTSSSMPQPVVPAQSDTSTVVPTATVTVILVCGNSCVVETSTVVPTDTSTPEVTPTDTSTPSPTDTSTPEVTPTDTSTPSPTDTSTPEVTPTDTSTPSPTDTSTPEVTPTDTSTPEVTPTDTSTPEVTPTDTPTPEVTPTDTPTPEVTPTDTPTPTPIPTDTPTPTPEVIPTDTPTPTPIPTDTPTPTPEVTPTTG